MGRTHQENTATFAEVFTTSAINCQQARYTGSTYVSLLRFLLSIEERN